MKNKFGELFSIKQPFDIKTTEDTSAESFTQKILVVMRNNIDNAIVGEIVKTATAEGVTDLAILNKAEIIKALEKQIPKNPLDIEETKYKVFYKCPVCGTVHTNEWCGTNWKLPFCSICGQALDWSDSE